MSRRGHANALAPSSRSTQPDHTDDVFEWIRRQSNPVKLKAPKPTRPSLTTLEDALIDAIQGRKRKEPVVRQHGELKNTETQEEKR